MKSLRSKKVLFVFDTGIYANIDAFADMMHITGYDFTMMSERFLLERLSKKQLEAGWNVIPCDEIFGSCKKEEAEILSKSDEDFLRGTKRSCRYRTDNYSSELINASTVHLRLKRGLEKIINKFSCVIIPDEFCWFPITVRDVAIDAGVPVILNQCGPMHKEGFEFFPTKATHVCAWSKAYADRFKENGSKNVYITGAPRFDIYFSGMHKKKPDGISYFPTNNAGQFDKGIYDYVNLEAMKLGYVKVQHHPHDCMSRHPCTERLLFESVAAVSIFSTVLFEAMLCEVPAIQILPEGIGSPIDYPNRFNTAKEALDFINKNDLSKQNKWIDKHYVRDGKATMRFVDVIMEVCNA